MTGTEDEYKEGIANRNSKKIIKQSKKTEKATGKAYRFLAALFLQKINCIYPKKI